MNQSLMELASRPDLILSLRDEKSSLKVKYEVTSKVCAKGRAAQMRFRIIITGTRVFV